MLRFRAFRPTVVAACAFLLVAATTPAALAPEVLFNFSKSFNAATVATNDAVAVLTNGILQVKTGVRNRWPGITLKAPTGKWDLSAYQRVKVKLHNTTPTDVRVSCRVDNPGADGTRHCVSASLLLASGKTETLVVPMSSTPWRLVPPLELVGMRGAPGGFTPLDPANVTQLLLFVADPKEPAEFEIQEIRAEDEMMTFNSATFLPFIDELGQFIQRDWPGKTHGETELAAQRKQESQDLARHPGPENRTRFGGWSGGPKLAATGFFRVEKYQGKWWLVDPEGRLFWSHGVTCVRAENATPVTKRENYFRGLPAKDSPFARFYSADNRWAPHGFYSTNMPYTTYDFGSANLLRKYGPGYPIPFAEISHRRLKSWGMNSIANWSDAAVYRLRRTPYTATININAPSITGSQGYWGKFPDPFAPEFRESLRQSLERERNQTAGDPWCLGYFVQNELSWGGDGISLALATLTSLSDQPAKREFVDDLKARYPSVEKLNDAWMTRYVSWDALLKGTNAPEPRKAGPDLQAFYSRVAETYFRVVSEELKKVAPSQLYLGCRFAWVNDLAIKAAHKYCDVISFNKYTYSVADLRLPEGLDKPVIIGEFHFGALDRGLFHTGLKATLDQDDRAAKYREYLQGALRNPLVVGTHWFQYKDQCTTGRGDGENYQIGFLDICDTPYPEIVQAARAVGYGMYEYRQRN